MVVGLMPLPIPTAESSYNDTTTTRSRFPRSVIGLRLETTDSFSTPNEGQTPLVFRSWVNTDACPRYHNPSRDRHFRLSLFS